jgi:hypothetical protein
LSPGIIGEYPFNCGVLVIDLAPWRRENIGARLVDIATRFPKCRFQDQDVLTGGASYATAGGILHTDTSNPFLVPGTAGVTSEDIVSTAQVDAIAASTGCQIYTWKAAWKSDPALGVISVE